MIVIGITGSFGTGKTTVAKLFKKLGAKVIDADRISHSLLRPGTEVYRRVVRIFGKGVISKNKTIDRVKLGKVVFGNHRLLKRLTGIIHPLVVKRIKLSIENNYNARAIVIDAPLLLEAGLDSVLDFLVVVKAKRNNQIKRIEKKFGLKKLDILKRIKAQLPLEKKISLADFIIDNNGTIKKTVAQVKEIYDRLKRSER